MWASRLCPLPSTGCRAGNHLERFGEGARGLGLLYPQTIWLTDSQAVTPARHLVWVCHQPWATCLMQVYVRISEDPLPPVGAKL